MQITLTPELESALTRQAQKAGKTPERLALDLLHEQLTELPLTQPADQSTLADFLADYIGVISSGEHRPGGAGLSEDTGRSFATLLTKRQQEGRL